MLMITIKANVPAADAQASRSASPWTLSATAT